MTSNKITSRMNIQEPADKLAKTVGRPLQFHIGDRAATFFTKSTEYGKLIDNNHNDYLKQDQALRNNRTAFSQSQHFHIGSDVSDAGTFGYAAPFDDLMEDATNTADARSETYRVMEHRHTQTHQARQDMATQIGSSLRTDNAVQSDMEDIAASTGSGRPPPPDPGAGGV